MEKLVQLTVAAILVRLRRQIAHHAAFELHRPFDDARSTFVALGERIFFISVHGALGEIRLKVLSQLALVVALKSDLVPPFNKRWHDRVAELTHAI